MINNKNTSSSSFDELVSMHKSAQSPSDSAIGTQAEKGNSRISKISLYTEDLEAQKEYYSRSLGLPIPESNESAFSIEFGDSILEFIRSADGTNPVYHYAINIPTNKFKKAKEWLRSRTALLLDSNTGADEFYFNSWDAHAVYFKDASGNIGELIARHTLDNASDGEFTQADLLGISEIGTPFDVPSRLGSELKRCFGLDNYMESEMFIGDAHGLFVIPPTGRTWIPERTAPALINPTEVEVRDKQLHDFIAPSSSYRIKGRK